MEVEVKKFSDQIKEVKPKKEPFFADSIPRYLEIQRKGKHAICEDGIKPCSRLELPEFEANPAKLTINVDSVNSNTKLAIAQAVRKMDHIDNSGVKETTDVKPRQGILSSRMAQYMASKPISKNNFSQRSLTNPYKKPNTMPSTINATQSIKFPYQSKQQNQRTRLQLKNTEETKAAKKLQSLPKQQQVTKLSEVPTKFNNPRAENQQIMKNKWIREQKEKRQKEQSLVQAIQSLKQLHGE